MRVRDAFLKRVELSYIGRGSKNPFQLPNPRVSVQPCNCGTACAEAEQRSSTFEGQGSAFPVMRPRSRVERATSAKISVSSSFYCTSEISSNRIKKLGFSTHKPFPFHTLCFSFLFCYIRFFFTTVSSLLSCRY